MSALAIMRSFSILLSQLFVCKQGYPNNGGRDFGEPHTFNAIMKCPQLLSKRMNA
jgi:hypothetical protein